MFLAVVWSIGAAFLALEAGMMEFTDLGLSQWFPAGTALPRQSQAAIAHCREVVSVLPPPRRVALGGSGEDRGQ